MKKFAAILVAVAMSVTVVGCKKKAPADNTPAARQTDRRTPATRPADARPAARPADARPATR